MVKHYIRQHRKLLIANKAHIEEEELIIKLKEKSKGSFDYLYDHYSGALMGIALRVLKDKDSAEEVVHDTFMKIWEGIDSYDSGKGRLFTWMARICKNSSLDHVKSKAFKKSTKTDSIGNIVVEREKGLSERITTDTIGVKEWMNVLDADQKSVIHALYFEGMSQSQAAEELDIPLGTVKTRLRLGLMRIRKKLGVT